MRVALTLALALLPCYIAVGIAVRYIAGGRHVSIQRRYRGRAGDVPMSLRVPKIPTPILQHDACAAWLVQEALVRDPTDELPAFLSIIVASDARLFWLNSLMWRLTISWRTVFDDGSPPQVLPPCAGPSTVESALVVLDNDDPVFSLKRALTRLSGATEWLKVVLWLRVLRRDDRRLSPRYLRVVNELLRTAWYANRWRVVVAVPRLAASAAGPLEGPVDVYGFDQPLDPDCVVQSARLLHSCPASVMAAGLDFGTKPHAALNRFWGRSARLRFFTKLAYVNLGGCPVRISAVHVPPMVIAYNRSREYALDQHDPALRGMGPCASDPGATTSCEMYMFGSLGAFANVLSQQLNFTPQVHFTSDVLAGEHETEVETLLGRHVAELVSHKTDLTISTLTVTESRLRFVQAVTFSTLSCFSWTVPKWAGQATSVLMPVVGEFSAPVWLLLLLALPMLGALLFAGTRSRPGPRPDLGQVALGLLSLLLAQPVAGRWVRVSSMLRGVLTILLFVNLLVNTAYTSTLLTTVTLRRPRADIETPEELFATDLRIRMPQVVLEMLRSGPSDLEPRLRPGAAGSDRDAGRMTRVQEFTEGLVTRRDTAVLDTKETVNFYRSLMLKRNRHDIMHQLKGCFAAFVETPVMMRRGSPLTPAVSRYWLAFNQAGLTIRWLRLLDRTPEPVVHANRELQLRDLAAAFYLLLIGWLLAASSLAVEKICARRTRHRRVTRNCTKLWKG